MATCPRMPTVRLLCARILSGASERRLLECIKAQTNTRVIQWAIENVDLVEFDCEGPKTSAALLREIFSQFIRGKGIWLSEEYYIGATNNPASRQAFRDAVVYRVHVLTGKKPRLNEQENSSGRMQWALFQE